MGIGAVKFWTRKKFKGTAERNRAVILPMSGRKLKFIIAGTHSMGGVFGCQYSERRAGGEVVHVEVAPGVVIVVAAWMLDPAACAGMALGAPRVSRIGAG